MSNDKADATYHPEPIVPPYMARRARISVILARYIADAEAAGNSPLVATLEAFGAEVIAALDPEWAPGGDAHA